MERLLNSIEAGEVAILGMLAGLIVGSLALVSRQAAGPPLTSLRLGELERVLLPLAAGTLVAALAQCFFRRAMWRHRRVVILIALVAVVANFGGCVLYYDRGTHVDPLDYTITPMVSSLFAAPAFVAAMVALSLFGSPPPRR